MPARVSKETGEQYFSPETVEHIQALLKSNKEPDKVVETPVYEYIWSSTVKNELYRIVRRQTVDSI